MEPLHFEDYVAKNQTVFQNDPQRELLIYPSDDVSVSIQKNCLFKNNPKCIIIFLKYDRLCYGILQISNIPG